GELLALLQTALPIDDVVRLLLSCRHRRAAAVDTYRRWPAGRRGTRRAADGVGAALPELDDRGGRLFFVLALPARSLRLPGHPGAVPSVGRGLVPAAAQRHDPAVLLGRD